MSLRNVERSKITDKEIDNVKELMGIKLTMNISNIRKINNTIFIKVYIPVGRRLPKDLIPKDKVIDDVKYEIELDRIYSKKKYSDITYSEMLECKKKFKRMFFNTVVSLNTESEIVEFIGYFYDIVEDKPQFIFDIEGIPKFTKNIGKVEDVVLESIKLNKEVYFNYSKLGSREVIEISY